jgi:ribosomal protein S10
MVEKQKNQKTKLRIKLKSYDIKMLEASVSKVVGLLIKSGATIK